MTEATISRKFRVTMNYGNDVFDNIKAAVNYMIADIVAHPEIFPTEVFKSMSRNAAKTLYNHYKKLLKEQGRKLSFDFLERVYRCVFQYVYFPLSNYHRRKMILQDIAKSLTGSWWENWDSLGKNIKIESLKNVKNHEKSDAMRQYRNLLIKELKDDPILNDNEIKTEFGIFVKTFEPEIENFKKMKTAFKQQVGKRINVAHKKLKKQGEFKGWAAELVRKIHKTEWSGDRKAWRKQQNKEFNKLSAREFLQKFEFTDDLPSYNTIINGIFFPKKDRGRVTSGSIAGFHEYVRIYLNSQCINAFLRYLSEKYSDRIKQTENKFSSLFSQHYPDILKLPEFKSRSLPFGADEGNIYTIDGNEHSFRLKKDEEFTKIKLDDDRYTDLLKSGWMPKRGVLCLSKGKLLLCLPLTKEVPDELKSTQVAGVDLGLKDGMVISVYDIEQEEEVDRQFLDQKQLAGKKDEWFLPKEEKPEPFNFKAKLFRLRYLLRKTQSARMLFDHPRKHNTRAYWYLRREEKKRWDEIKGIHRELVNQFATRLVAYCETREIHFIAFEDLKWSTHSLKSKVGRYLAHWQIHWFFAQIQQKTEEIASLYGIVVKQVNAKNTSQNCHKCGKKGKRERKTFTCVDKCWQGDSDLNAARNIAKRGIKGYHSHQKYLERKEKNRQKKLLEKKEKDKLQKLHASEDGSRKVEKSTTTSK